MTTIYPNGYRVRPKHRARLSPRAVLVLVVLILLVGGAALWRTQAAGVVWQALGPVFGARASALPAAGIFAEFSSKAALAARNQELAQQVAELEAKAADRDALYQENLDLKAGFGRTDAAVQTVLAGVIARPPATPYDTLTIDAGEDHGVEKGNLVSAGGGALVGSVSEVYASTARVTLFSAPGTSYQGFLNGQFALTVAGQGNGALTAEVPAGTQAAPGDTVEMPGIASGVSEVVSGIEQQPGDSFKLLHLHLPVAISSLRFVEVLRNTALTSTAGTSTPDTSVQQ